jgi:hypothetical protein
MKKSIVILLAIILIAFASSDALACYHPQTLLAYRKGPICYGFVRDILKTRGKDGVWRYSVEEVLTELPCPKR